MDGAQHVLLESCYDEHVTLPYDSHDVLNETCFYAVSSCTFSVCFCLLSRIVFSWHEYNALITG